MGLFWVESNVNGLGESKRSKKLKVDDGKNWRSWKTIMNGSKDENWAVILYEGGRFVTHTNYESGRSKGV